MAQLPIHLSDSTAWTTTALRVDLERLKTTYDVGWVVIDYESLLQDDPDVDFPIRSANIASRVHAIAKDLDLAVLAIDDQNKQRDMSGSARKRFDADQIIRLEADKTNPKLVHLVWEKLREGERPDRGVPLRRGDGFPLFQNVSLP